MTTEAQFVWSPMASSLAPRGQALKDSLCQVTERFCAEEFGRRLQAIVLTGSLSRNEATSVEQGPLCRVMSDADFLIVFKGRASLPAVSELAWLGRRIEVSLQQRGIFCRMSLNAVHPRYLRKLTPHIFAYELCASGQVVWGDPQILQEIPSFSVSDIPLEDAWCLLLNRMVEQLEIVDETKCSSESFRESTRYRTVKLYLDMATSFLLFAGAYEPTYRGRARRLRLLAENMPSQGCPFPLADFYKRVSDSTQWKLSPGAADDRIDREFWVSAVNYACSLWRWELACLTRKSLEVSDHELHESWRQREPFSRRMRGWLHVLRKQGWHHSWRHWPYWGLRAFRNSPRYWVYAAVAELFPRLPDLLRSDGESVEINADWEGFREWLPVKTNVSKAPHAWRRLASDILWNYSEFLQGTRA